MRYEIIEVCQDGEFSHYAINKVSKLWPFSITYTRQLMRVHYAYTGDSVREPVRFTKLEHAITYVELLARQRNKPTEKVVYSCGKE